MTGSRRLPAWALPALLVLNGLASLALVDAAVRRRAAVRTAWMQTIDAQVRAARAAPLPARP